MPRLLFEKTGNAIFISHLDLMRLFQRAFKRARLKLTHTQGFNPRPSVSIPLPLSVGVESVCEMLDFQLDGETVACDEIRDRLNAALVDGIRVREVYENGRKNRELAFLGCIVALEYDRGVPAGTEDAIQRLFSMQSLTVSKKSKNGTQEQDIIPMIRKLELTRKSETVLEIQAMVCCQEPSLNPAQLALAIETYLPQLKPDFFKCRRLEVFDRQETIFR